MCHFFGVPPPPKQRQRELKQEQQAVRSSLHNQRLAAARARRYYSEYELRLKAKLQKRRTKEEQVSGSPLGYYL